MMSIPQQVIFEVFSWLPVKSLMRFKCVSKFCNSLVSEFHFVDIHRCRSMNRPGRTKLLVRELLLQIKREVFFYTIKQSEDANQNSHFHPIKDFDGLYDKVGMTTFLECVNGLFCFWSWSTQDSRPALIFNPSTRKARFLPHVDVDHFVCHYSLGFEPEEKIYKVVFMKPQYTNEGLETYTRSWLFTLGTDESWREIKFIPEFYRSKEGVCINGTIYMLNCLPKKNNIVAFNVKAESFETITLWEALRYDVDYYNLIEVKGKLAVLEGRIVDDGEINFWILGHEGWETHIILDFPLIRRKKVRFCCQTYSDGEIIVVVNKADKFSYFCYDVRRKSWRECEVEGFHETGTIGGIHTCPESLFPIGKVL